MTANQYSASVPRHQGSPDRPGGTADRVDSSTGGRHRPSDDDDSPYFPPLMIALILAVFMIWIGIYKAHAAEVAGPATMVPAVVQMKDVDAPGLLLRARRPGFYVLAPTVASDVDVTISAAVARTRVTQRFRNPSDGWIEGIYVFPLPEGAAVDTLRMIIGDRAIEGRIEERAAARAAFEEAKADGRKAALIEQERPNLFTNSVANIGPGESVVVQIEFQQQVSARDGVSSLRIPLVAAPRYTPPGDLHLVADPVVSPAHGDPAPDRERLTFPVRHPAAGSRNPVSLTVALDAGFAIGRITSSSHQITVDRTGEQTATLTLGDGEVPADRDFELTWAATAGAEPAASLFHERAGSVDYVLAMIAPPVPGQGDKANDRPGREVVFVIDNSGSMAGASMRQAKAGLDLALRRLTPGDRFNVIRFDDTMEALFRSPVEATPEATERARRWVAGLDANGGTEMLPALRAALADAEPGDTRLRQVIFITDGAIGNEEQLFAEIEAGRGRSRIFTVGIGSAPNSFFMTRAAMAGRGTFTHIGSADEVADRMATLFHKLERPAITDLEAVWPAGVDSESWPNPLPDVYLGEPVVIAARASSLAGALTLRGRIDGRPWETTVDLGAAAPGTGIAKLWARRKIAELEGRRYGAANAELFDREILATARDHGLVSRLTSMVAVDVTPSRQVATVATQAYVPVDLPAGWEFDKVFGPDPEMRDAGLDDTVKRRYASLLQVAGSRGQAIAIAQASRGIDLPEGATVADRKILVGLLALAFALMVAVATLAGRRALRLFQVPPFES